MWVCIPFHPTIGSEEFTLSTLATPMPSHDITRESMSFLRDLLSVTTSLRGLSDASSTSSSRPSSFHLHIQVARSPLCMHSYLVSLLLSVEPLVHTSSSVCLLLVSPSPVFSSGRLWTCHVPSVRRKLESVWACRKTAPCGTSG
jgi:hypothetical protein